MKRVLALVLALLMVLSGMVFTVSAEEPDEIAVPAMNGETSYFKQKDGEGYIGNLGGVSCQNVTLNGSMGDNNGKFRWSAAYGGTEISFDITKMSYFCFDFYTSSATAVSGVTALFELTSSNQNDLNNANRRTALTDFVVGELKDGWNTLCIDLSTLNENGIDKTAVNYIRFVLNSAWEAGEGTTLGFKNLRFTKKVPTTEVDEIAIPAMNGETSYFKQKPEDGYTGKIDGVDCQTNIYSGSMAANTARFRWVGSDISFDISKMNYFCFDLYTSNAAAIKNVVSLFEIASSGANDVNDARTDVALSTFVVGTLKDGWNTICVPLTSLNNVDMDYTHFNYARFVLNGAWEAGESTVIGYKNLRFTKVAPEAEKVTYTDAVLKYTAEFKNGVANFMTIAHPQYTVVAGDYISYKVLTSTADAAVTMGHVDMNFDDGSENGTNYRDSGAKATDGTNAHPGTAISTLPDGQWYTRQLPLDGKVGQIIKDFQLSCHPAAVTDANTHVAYYDDIVICGADGTEKVVIFRDAEDLVAADVKAAIVIGVTATVELAETPVVKQQSGDPESGDPGEGAADEGATVVDGKVVENHTFTLYEESELKYRHVMMANDNKSQYFTDNNAYVIFKYTVTNRAEVESVIWKAKTSGQLLLSVTTDTIRKEDTDDAMEANWIDVYDAGTEALPAEERTYDLTSYLVEEDGTMPSVFYIMVSDSDPNDGNGGSIWGGVKTQLTVTAADYTRDYNFVVDDGKTEEKYLVRSSGSTNAGCRFNDGDTETVYKYTIKDTAGVKKILWKAKLDGQLLLQFTTADASKTSEVEWVELFKFVPEAGAEQNATIGQQYMTFDLTEYLVNGDGSLKAESFYIRIADSVTPGGWGGNIATKVPTTLFVVADTVEAAEPVEEEPESQFDNAVLKFTATYAEGANYCFFKIKDVQYEIKAGDYLMYEVRVPDAASIKGNMGHIDFALVDSEKDARDLGVKDTEGLTVHPNNVLTTLTPGVWHTRTISLDSLAGKTISKFYLATHPAGREAAGEYTAYYDNIVIYNASGLVKCVIFADDTDVKTADFNGGFNNKITGNVDVMECMEYAHEYHIFTPLDEEGTEAAYLVETDAGNNGSCRFSDTSKHTTYKFQVKNNLSVEKITFTAVMGQQMLFSASMDGQNWVEIYKWLDDTAKQGAANAGWKITEHTLDLSNVIDFSVSDTVWIKIEDSYPSDGWGGSIYKDGDAVFDVWYVQLTDAELDAYEMKRTDHKVPIFGCNADVGAWKVDKENKVAGSASLSINVGKGAADGTKFDAVDATGMDTFEFDIWVSDTAFFTYAFADANFELTSKGIFDQEETSWQLSTIPTLNVGEAIIANTWCHVILPLSTAKLQGINLANVDFFRFFFVGAAEDTGFTVKIDNMCLTDYVKAKDEAAQAEADPVIKLIEALKDITFTEENSKTLKNQISKARNAYKKLSEDALAKISAKTLKILTDAEAARDAFNAATPTPTDTPTATPTGSADDKPVVADDKTGVKVSGDKLPEGAKLEVAVIAVDDVKTKVEEKGAEGMKEVGENAEILEVFDITITADGAKVQPDGSVDVTLPAPKTAVPEGKKLQVVYIDADGKVTPLDTTVNEDGTLTFNTTHFSYYAIVMADAPAQSSSNTVVIVIIIIVVVLAAAAVCVWLFVFKKKK